MATHGVTATDPADAHTEAPGVPWTMWAFAWSAVADQALGMARFGVRVDADAGVSALLGVGVATYFAHGVLRARPVRFWVVVVLLVVGLAAQLLLLPADPWILLGLLITTTQLALLARYRHSDWFAWQRTRPSGGPSLAAILALAVLVGAMAGVVEPHDAPMDVRINIGF